MTQSVNVSEAGITLESRELFNNGDKVDVKDVVKFLNFREVRTTTYGAGIFNAYIVGKGETRDGVLGYYVAKEKGEPGQWVAAKRISRSKNPD